MLEIIILGFLLNDDMSGYDIKRFMQGSIAYFYDASFGSIYPMLKKMEEKHIILSKEIIDGGKYRKVYSITEEGKALFLQWLEQPIELNRARHDHLVRVFFFDWLPAEKVHKLIGDFMQAVRAEKSALAVLSGQIAPHAHFYQSSTLEYGLQYYDFLLDWCSNFLANQNKLEQSGELKERQLQ
jgi:DNA-binding PadR family transcriptional regulator